MKKKHPKEELGDIQMHEEFQAVMVTHPDLLNDTASFHYYERLYFQGLEG